MFTTGLIVRLRTEGPEMVVNRVETVTHDSGEVQTIVSCVWFTLGEAQSFGFDPAALVPVYR